MSSLDSVLALMMMPRHWVHLRGFLLLEQLLRPHEADHNVRPGVRLPDALALLLGSLFPNGAVKKHEREMQEKATVALS